MIFVFPLDTGIFGTLKNDKMSQGNLSFAVIIPMFNEACGAKECVKKVCNVLQKTPHQTVLIVINDGSTDDTSVVLQRLEKKYAELHLIGSDVSQGYGMALRIGIVTALSLGLDYALFMDSDLTNHPKYIANFVPKMKAGIDIIKASRYVDGGKMENVSFLRRYISIWGNRIASLLFRIPIKDCTNGFRAVKLSILSKMPLKESGFAILMEEMLYAKYLAESFSEIPYTLTSRRDSPSSFAYNLHIFYSYLKYPIMGFFGLRHNLKSNV